MKIKWNGHSCFTITADNGTVIVTDPYESGAYNGGIGYEPVTDKTDVAIVSHDHEDHSHVQSLTGDFTVLKESGCVNGIEFSAVETAHDEKGGAERGKNMMFAFEVDGVKLVFAGDLGHVLNGAQVKEFSKVDILLTPIGGVFTIDSAGAKELVGQLKPKVVVPMHFKTEKCGFPLATVDDFAKHMTSVKKPGQSEVEVNKKDLPDSGPEVWVLEYAK
jgi:L-ascorbate metabolism protein UlaG (beta-lactamase superfamily)